MSVKWKKKVYILVFYCICKYQQHDEKVLIKEYFMKCGVTEVKGKMIFHSLQN